ncbi:GPI transamidase [Angomonas deanei]|uniref:Gpi16 subunit, GPI transamidase component n=1 Tax=Angomonas deanei TaxID=59799 RepID=A0A7G2C5A9_9TRYP|nr:GPI transamidase [Angomonas deanei]CAD2214926.1 hypothetical protein, conserved [Angomonas deanei]|eukprot:EPY35374.1 GPI transamidase [Angomonas deanei]
MQKYWIVLLVLCASWVSAADRFVAKSARSLDLSLEDLTRSDDDVEQPVLISLVDSSTVFVPTGARVEDITFDEGFEPIWFYLLERQGFQEVEWSGCNGHWRSEWSIHDEKDDPLRHIRHEISQHVICSYSSVAFCGMPADAKSSETVRGPEEQYQWGAQFISTLTASPLSWTSDTPRHIRPNGVVVADDDVQHSDVPWCSYHHVYHDTLCTQHVAPLLRSKYGGRHSADGLQGPLRSIIPSLTTFFSTEFSQARLHSSQQHVAANSTYGQAGIEYTLNITMTFVVKQPSEKAEVAALWSSALPQYVHHKDVNVTVRIGSSGLDPVLMAALPTELILPRGGAEKAAPISADAGKDSEPDVFYELEKPSRHVLALNVFLQPRQLQTTIPFEEYKKDKEAPRQTENLKVGDTVRALILFPLHLLRPELHLVESVGGATEVEGSYVDTRTNTLAVVLRITLTEVHMKAYYSGLHGVLIARLYVTHGWVSLGDMPRDANSLRMLPQPVITVERSVATTAAASCSAVCHKEGTFFSTKITHDNSLRHILEKIATQHLSKDWASRHRDRKDSKDGCVCSYSLRATNVAGTTLPVPDPAMTFNAMSVGLAYLCILGAALARLTQNLYCRRDQAVLPETAEETEKKKKQ